MGIFGLHYSNGRLMHGMENVEVFYPVNSQMF